MLFSPVTGSANATALEAASERICQTAHPWTGRLCYARQKGRLHVAQGRRGVPLAAALGVVLAPVATIADEGGSSVWYPGQFASFAAVPGDPGFSLEGVFYFRKASA